MKDAIPDMLIKNGIKRWRIATVFLKGRAKDNPLFQLTSSEFKQIFKNDTRIIGRKVYV